MKNKRAFPSLRPPVKVGREAEERNEKEVGKLSIEEFESE